jgi:GH43 family beta-xylosidase
MTAKKIIAFAFTMLFTGIVSAQNPFIKGQFTADPTARVFNGRMYVYPSHDIPAPADKPNLRKDWFCMEDYHVFSSDNLTDWTDHGVIVSQENVAWVNSDTYSMWAPDCVYKDGMYYFYFPAIVKPDSVTKKFGMMIGVAVSDRPDGGFVPMKEPIRGIYGIDPCTLIDDDGQAYIYWGGRGLQGARLKPNMLQIDSEPVVIEQLPDGMKEGPFVFKRNGKYYFTFPWVPKEGETENLSYAMGDSPLGPFEYKGLIMDQSPTKCWTNHHSIVEFNGEWYIFYHHNDYSPQFDKNRSVRIDRIHFNDDGTIQKVIPTLRGVGITNATDEIQIDRYSELSKAGAAVDYIDTTDYFAGWKTILSAKNAFVQYNDVDFGSAGLSSVSVKVIQGKGTISVKADGQTVAKIPVKQAGLISVPLKNIPQGRHSLSVVMEDNGTVEIDWIKFEENKI